MHALFEYVEELESIINGKFHMHLARTGMEYCGMIVSGVRDVGDVG